MSIASDLRPLLENKVLLSIASAAFGAIVGNFVAVLRARIRVLEYSVSHSQIGLSAEDPVFGSVRVTWQGHDVRNLYSSTVTLSNRTTHDYSNVVFKVFTGNDTLLLNERTELVGTSYILHWASDFAAQLAVAPGATPTDQQWEIHRHRREYAVATFNKGQVIIVQYLTTVPNQNTGPLVWLDLLHPGVRAKYVPGVPVVHGVPVKLALSLGLIVCLAVLISAVLWINNPWLIAAICMFVGLGAQAFGALVFRVLLFAKKLVIR